MKLSTIAGALALLMAMPALVKAQTYSASNFTLVSNINPEQGLNNNGDKYSACWGWTQPVSNKEFAIACSKSGTYWVDITNPTTPTVSAYVAGTFTNGTWREVKTYQNYCYVICDDAGAAGFQVFDMSTLPATVTLVSSNMNLFKRGHTCWVDGNKLYVSSVTYSNNSFSSLNVYSLANPAAPVLLRELSQDYPIINSVHDVFVRNDTVFASCGYQGLFVYRFTAANTFSVLGSLLSYPSAGYNHSSALTPDGKTLVFLDEVPAGLPLKVANVSNFGNIQVKSTANQFSLTTPHNPFMYNNQYCFISAYQDGTQLWDISNPSSPYLAGFFDTFPNGGGNNSNWSGSDYDGQWGMYPYFPSGNIFALDELNGIFILRTHVFGLPEIDILGNAASIPDGAISTTTANNTGFGDVPVTGSLSHTFTIKNTGPGTLTISTMSITGAGAAQFSVTGAPALPFNVTASASVVFTVSFKPATVTSHTALITIGNNDLNEGSYDFKLGGKGVANTSVRSYGSFETGLSMMPNPARSQVMLDLAGIVEPDMELLIRDGQGKTVKVQKLLNVQADGRYTLSVEELGSGVYFAELRAGGKTLAENKLIISR